MKSGMSRRRAAMTRPALVCSRQMSWGPTVDRLAELAGAGRALEFAIGTGRVAVPLSERGVPVAGIELSPAMVGQLRTKVDDATRSRLSSVRWPQLPRAREVRRGSTSRASTAVPRTCSHQAEQVSCSRNAARRLEPGRGRFVIEPWVPSDLRTGRPASRPSSSRPSRLHRPRHLRRRASTRRFRTTWPVWRGPFQCARLPVASPAMSGRPSWTRIGRHP